MSHRQHSCIPQLAALTLIAAAALMTIIPTIGKRVDSAAAERIQPAETAQPLPTNTRRMRRFGVESSAAESTLSQENIADVGAMTYVLRRIVANDRSFSEFAYYHDHVLLNVEQRDSYRDFLSDPEVLSKVRDDLAYPEETEESIEGNVKRLVEIDYLKEAIAWKENPERETAFAVVEDVILENNIPSDMDRGLRTSLAGNKMEMYRLLDDSDPTRAASVLERAKASDLSRLIQYISEQTALRKQTERALALAVSR